MKEGFTTPPGHVAFLAKKLFGEEGRILDGSIAYLEKGGGGPDEKHTHPHDHLFIVTEGEARIELGEEIIILKENESYLVPGIVPHSVWNNAPGQTVMIGVSVCSERK